MRNDGKSMFLFNSVRSFELNVSKISYALQHIICDRLTHGLLYGPLRWLQTRIHIHNIHNIFSTRVFDPFEKKKFFF